MPGSEAEAPLATERSSCPQCSARLVVQRIIPGRAGLEYWTLRCTRCGQLHQNAVKTSHPASLQV